MRKVFVILLLLFVFVAGAQTGGRMKERKNQKRLHYHITHQSGGGWKYRKTPSKKGTLNTNYLFKRQRTYNSKKRDKIQRRINRERTLRRVHGNDVFYKRKYK